MLICSTLTVQFVIDSVIAYYGKLHHTGNELHSQHHFFPIYAAKKDDRVSRNWVVNNKEDSIPTTQTNIKMGLKNTS